MSATLDTIHPSPVLPGRVRIEAHAVLDSTNHLAKSRAREGAPAWTVIQSAEQTAGRGRRGREWRSPPGNLYTSTILHPPTAVTSWPQLSFVAALAVADTARALAPKATVTVKWPNDVLADRLKVSGILLETVHGPAGGAVVVGVGINLVSHPPDTRYGATNLAVLSGEYPPVDNAAAHYLIALARWYDIWSERGFEEIRAAWTEIAHGLGCEVRVDGAAGGFSEGRLKGIDEEGRLLLGTRDGGVERIAAGTVSFGTPGEA